jgi:hypothetical protein
MGRITPSFRQLYHQQVEELKRGFQHTLLDRSHREAFNLIIKEAWSTEGHAMANAGVPCTLDIMNLMANVDNKKVIVQLRARIREYEERINHLEERLKEMTKLAEVEEIERIERGQVEGSSSSNQ